MQYYAVVDLTYRRVSSESFVKSSQVVYYLMLFIHWVSCCWLVTNRLDPEASESESLGWYAMDNLYYPHTMWDAYLDAVFWAHTTMGGAGFGNVVASTTLEWVVAALI